MGKAHTSRSDLQARESFLKALAAGATITRAAKLAGRGRATLYEWKEADEAFAAAWEEALDTGNDLLEEEARRRAVEGVEKPLVSGGRVVCDRAGEMIMIREYSDSLLQSMLRAKKPKEYRERVDANVGGTLKVVFGDGDSDL